MTHNALVALTLIAGTLPISVASAQPMAPAPAAGPNAQYCLRVNPVTGSNVETVQCWTREEWAEQDVDVDLAWAREGVAVLG